LARGQTRVSQWCGVIAVGLALGTSACRSGDVASSEPSTDTTATPAAGGTAASETAAAPGAGGARHRAPLASERKPPLASPPWRIPVGPRLEIMPGKGFGPIRFGAHVDTIERLIGEPCEEKRDLEGGEVLCRFSAQAVDFVLKDGGVVEMRGHRLGRPFKPEPKLDYGIFNGRFEQGVAFGMVPPAVRELLGAPKSTRSIEGENPNHTVEVYEYDNLTLEFDRISESSVVLGGVILKAPPATPARKAAAKQG
jgi:hypothetical protein